MVQKTKTRKLSRKFNEKPTFLSADHKCPAIAKGYIINIMTSSMKMCIKNKVTYVALHFLLRKVLS